MNHITSSIHFQHKYNAKNGNNKEFGNIYICTYSDYVTYSNSVVECYNDTLYLNYYSSRGISLCYGGGNVGIGTSSPSYKLDVNGNTRMTSITLQAKDNLYYK